LIAISYVQQLCVDDSYKHDVGDGDLYVDDDDDDDDDDVVGDCR